MLKRMAQEQTGAAMTAFMVVLWAFIGLTALGLTVMGIFLTHVRAMNAADAAAEAALVALKEPMIDAMTAKSAENLDAFWRSVEAEVDEKVSDWEEAYETRRRAQLEAVVPPLDPGVIEAIIAQEIAQRLPSVTDSYRSSTVRSREPEIADLLLSGNLSLIDQFQHFLTAQEVGCIAKEVGESNQARMVDWAGKLAKANFAEAPRSQDVMFSTDGSGVRVRVLVPYAVHFFVLDQYVDGGHRYLTGEAVHQLQQVAGIDVGVPATCP